MKKILYYLPFLCLSMLLAMSACSDDNKEMPEPEPTPEPEPEPEPTPPTVTYTDGFNYSVETLDADQPVTITFKAPTGTDLYGSKGDMYLYSGAGPDWEGAPNWTDNNAKYKMTAVDGQSSTWSISLPTSIRSFYGISSTTPIQLLNLIVRTADGSKQTGDYTTLVQDAKNNFTLTPTETQTAPVSGTDAEGIHINSASSATLVLYDYNTAGKRKDYAFAIGDFSNWQLDSKYQMKYDETKHCWWLTLDGLKAGETAFQYFVYSTTDGGSYLGDPYSEKVLEKNVDGNFPARAAGQYVSIINTQPETYNWAVNDFKIESEKSLVIYEMLLRDFTTGHNLEEAQTKLPYLKAMGVNAIELMPVQEFDGKDSWGYNTSFYFALDGSYGTQQQYKAFIDACHKEGIAVIVDVVYNHTNNNNPFAKLYWDFYNNRPSAGNPWLNAETPHKKYVFSPDDFNHSSELTRAFVKRNLRYLLETYRIDGFRFDFTKGFTQKKTTGDDDLAAYDADRVAVLKEYYDAVKAAKSDAVVIMEHFCDSEESTLSQEGVSFWRNMNYAYCQSAMGWKDDSSFSGLYDASSKFVGYMESHDEERMGYKQTQWGDGALKTDPATRISQLAANAAFFFTVPGPKMVWQFGELGYDFSINSNEAGTSVSEDYRTARKPIRWDYYEDATRKELYEVYSKLIALRNEKASLFAGNATFTWKAGVSDWDKGRSLTLTGTTGESIVVIGNFSKNATSVTFPAATGEWYNYLSGKNETITGSVPLPAHSFAVYTRF